MDEEAALFERFRRFMAFEKSQRQADPPTGQELGREPAYDPLNHTRQGKDPRIEEAGTLLARIDTLQADIAWRKANLAAGLHGFPLYATVLQVPSLDRFRPTLATDLNTLITDCARACSELVLAEEEAVLAEMHIERQQLAANWIRSRAENQAIEEIREIRRRPNMRRHPKPAQEGTRPAPIAYFLPPSNNIPWLHLNQNLAQIQTTRYRIPGRSPTDARSNDHNRSRSHNRPPVDSYRRQHSPTYHRDRSANRHRRNHRQQSPSPENRYRRHQRRPSPQPERHAQRRDIPGERFVRFDEETASP